MKKFILIIMTITSIQSFAGQDGGGGIVASAEFVSVGYEAIRILSLGDESIKYIEIAEKIKGTKVIPVDNVCQMDHNTGGQYCEDAHYNKPENIVYFSLPTWQKLNCIKKMTLSSHEFMRAAGLEDEDYKYSGRFLTNTILKVCEHSEDSDLAPEEQKKAADKCVHANYQVEMAIRRLCERISR